MSAGYQIEMIMKPQREICCFNMQSALIAQKAGANRVELCADPNGGGTTPSHGFIKEARKNLHIALYPIIRPRGGDFLFSQEEFQIMLEELVGRKTRRVVFDLSSLNHIDSVGLGLLYIAQEDLAGQGAKLSLASPQDAVYRLLELTEANKTFEITR